jgi:hypothetical protein
MKGAARIIAWPQRETKIRKHYRTVPVRAVQYNYSTCTRVYQVRGSLNYLQLQYRYPGTSNFFFF